MNEFTDDIWKYHATDRESNIICITTNGCIDKDRNAIMGRGIALDAKTRFPWIPQTLGRMIITTGNHVYYLGANLVAFPTKEHWKNNSDINLIIRSCQELMALKWIYHWDKIILPRPGCENGKLEWSSVKYAIAPILDDSVFIITK